MIIYLLLSLILINTNIQAKECQLKFVDNETGEVLPSLDDIEIDSQAIPVDSRFTRKTFLNGPDRGKVSYPCKDSWEVTYEIDGTTHTDVHPLIPNNSDAAALEIIKQDVTAQYEGGGASIVSQRPILTTADNNAQDYLKCAYRESQGQATAVRLVDRCLSGSTSEVCTKLKAEGIDRAQLQEMRDKLAIGVKAGQNHLRHVMMAAGIDPTQYTPRYECGEEDEGENSEYTKTCGRIDSDYSISRGEGNDLDAFCTSLDLIQDSGLKYFVSDVADILQKNDEQIRKSYSFLLRAEAIGQTLDNYKKYIGGTFDNDDFGGKDFLTHAASGKCGEKYAGTNKSLMDGITKFQNENNSSKGIDPSSASEQKALYDSALELKKLLNGAPLSNAFVCFGRTSKTIRECCESKELKVSYEDSQCSEVTEKRKQRINQIMQSNPLLTTAFKNVEGEGTFSETERGLYDMNSWGTLKKIIDSGGNPEKMQDAIQGGKKILAKQYMDYIEKMCDPSQIPNKNLFLNPQLTENVTNVLGFKETQRCLSTHFKTMERNAKMLRDIANLACIPGSFTGVGAVVCGVYAIGGATYDNAVQQERSAEASQQMSGQGGTKGFLGASEEAQAADDGLGGIAFSTVTSIPGAGVAGGLKSARVLKSAKGIQYADNIWTGLVTTNNSIVSYQAFSDVEYDEESMRFKHLTTSQLEGLLTGEYIRYSEDERQQMIAAQVARHEAKFPYSSKDQYWRTKKMRELSEQYGSVPVADKLYDEDILRLQRLEKVMDDKGMSAADKTKIRRIIATNINKVDNPNGFLNLVEHQVMQGFDTE